MVPGRGCCVLIRLVRLSRHRVRVMILARTSTWPTVVHTAEVGALSTERWAVSQAARLSRLTRET